jgi:hypothetical protein
MTTAETPVNGHVATLPRLAWQSPSGYYRVVITDSGPSSALCTDPELAVGTYWSLERRDGMDLMGAPRWTAVDRASEPSVWRNAFGELAATFGVFGAHAGGGAVMTTEEMAYVAFRPCGCPVMATMEECRDAAREVARAIRRGERVEHMTVEAVRALTWRGCDQCRPSRTQQRERAL